MRNNKGFTLVELLAVITIIALLGIVALESIESVNRGNKEKAEKVQRESILESAIAYVPTSKVKLPNVIPGTAGCVTYRYTPSGTTGSGSSICEVRLSLSFLVQEGLLENKIEDPVAGKDLNMNNSYVSIKYLTRASDIPSSERDRGQFDGNYFYEVHYAY